MTCRGRSVVLCNFMAMRPLQFIKNLLTKPQKFYQSKRDFSSHIIKWCTIAIFYDIHFSIFSSTSSVLYTIFALISRSERVVKINGTSVFAKRTRKFLSLSASIYLLNENTSEITAFRFSLASINVPKVSQEENIHQGI